MTRNMTAGNPAKLILIFTFPLLIGNIFQQFYSMADTLIVGRTIGVNALAAVGCTGSISFLILGFVSGLTSGFSIVTAQRFGADDEKGVKKSFAAGILLSFAIALVLTVVSLGTRVVLANVLAAIPAIGVVGIWWSVPIGWFLADIVGLFALRKSGKSLFAPLPGNAVGNSLL